MARPAFRDGGHFAILVRIGRKLGRSGNWLFRRKLERHKTVYKKMKAILDPLENRDPGIIKFGEGVSIRFTQ